MRLYGKEFRDDKLMRADENLIFPSPFGNRALGNADEMQMGRKELL